MRTVLCCSEALVLGLGHVVMDPTRLLEESAQNFWVGLHEAKRNVQSQGGTSGR